jgi:glutamate carboxypeptidase
MKKLVSRKLLILICYAFCGNGFAALDPDLLNAAQKKQKSFVEDLQTLVNIDSGTDNQLGLAKVEVFLAKRLKTLGAKVEVLAAPPAVGNIIVGRFNGKGSKNIMMMIHYDTVFERGEAAKRPFKIAGNKAFGPGVADAKGGALIILHALDIARKRGNAGYHTLTVLFNPDEEKSSLGSRQLIKTLSAQQDVVLIYEPPEADRVTVATNGIAWVHLAVKGLSAHAGSAPEKGRNAALELSNQILQLKDLGNPAKGTTVNWTAMQAGNKDHVNIIPDQASAMADMRMSDLTELDRVQQDADKIIQNKLIPDTKVNVVVENRRPPFSKNAASDNLASVANSIYQELGKTIEPVAMRYGTDAGFAYNPAISKPAVLDGMGIVGDRIHSSDEWADLDSVAARLYLTVRMLELLA